METIKDKLENAHKEYQNYCQRTRNHRKILIDQGYKFGRCPKYLYAKMIKNQNGINIRTFKIKPVILKLLAITEE